MTHYASCLFFILFSSSGTHMLFSKIEKGKPVKLVIQGDVRGSSKGSYWPASTIKLLPAIAVMRSGINPRTHVRMKRYRGTVRALLRRSLSVSSNVAYDSLVDLVGQDYVNVTAKHLGLKHTWISIPYGRRGTFHYSAPYWLGKKYTKAKRAKLKNPKCKSNCTSLEDLQKMILYASKDKELRRWIQRHGKFAKVLKKYFPKVKVYCKSGYVAYRHGLTNCKFGNHIITIATPCGSRKNWNKNKKLRARMAESVLSIYLKEKRR